MMVSDEEKRWLVVGIAMNKVAAPVLRDFIKQGMDTHYTNLDVYCSGLATPCTLKTLAYHQVSIDPCFKHLKFQNVNNNLQLYGLKKKDLHKYNYNINSSVDLAKLFLPDYLATFSSFDDSLDMSAILRLLGFNNPAPIFYSPMPSISIQLSADDVRENVRNTWGHCNVTDWTEVFFNDCFSKLKTLVKSLGLTLGMEKMALDQLSDWETKGCQLCMGHAVDHNLLSLVQQDVKKLIMDYKTTEESLAQQRVDLTATQNTVTSIQDQQSATRVQLEEHGEQLVAVLEWKEQQMKENEEILAKLVSVKKMMSEELLIRVERVEKGHAETDDKVEQLEQGFAKTDDKVKQLEQGFAKTDDKVEQLEQGFAKTDDKVKQLGQGFARIEKDASETGDKVKQLEEEVRSQRMEENKSGSSVQGRPPLSMEHNQLPFPACSQTSVQTSQTQSHLHEVKRTLPSSFQSSPQDLKRAKLSTSNKAEASPVKTFDVKTCQRRLAEYYQKTAKVPTTVWTSKFQVDLEKIYTRLSWVKQEQTLAGLSQNELSRYTEIFTEKKKNGVAKRILVQGETGIGKTTFVKKLLLDWSNFEKAKMPEEQEDILRNFDLVVSVNLKEVSKCQTFKDVLSQSRVFPDDETSLIDDLLSYIGENQDKVLFVFDGYDEYRTGSEAEEKYGSRSNSPIYKIFHGSILRDCTVLVTTRSSCSDELQEFADIHLEITGFNWSDQTDFMVKFLGSQSEADELYYFLLVRNIHDLARVPLLNLFFCLLWKEEKKKLEEGLKSKTELFQAIVKHILHHSHKRHSPSNASKLIEADYNEILTEIGKVALEGLLRGDLLFTFGQLSEKVRGEKSVIVGLLQVSEFGPSVEPKEMVSFIHKSIQEYLAAWFVTYRCVPEGNLGGIEQQACTVEDCSALENVFQFLCGLSDKGAEKVFEHFSSVRTRDLSVTIADADNQTYLPLYDLTERHWRFSDLAFNCFREVNTRTELFCRFLDCFGDVVPVPNHVLRSQFMPSVEDVPTLAPSRTFAFRIHGSNEGPIPWTLEGFSECFRIPRITESSEILRVGDFLEEFQSGDECCQSESCSLDFILRFRTGQLQFYITNLFLACEDHARLFTETTDVYSPSVAANLCLKESCLEFTKSLQLRLKASDETMKSLGKAIRNCRYLNCIHVAATTNIKLPMCIDVRDGDSVCHLLEQVPNPCKCSLKLGSSTKHTDGVLRYVHEVRLTSAGAVKLASLLPRFNNVSVLNLSFVDAEVDALITSISRKSLKNLRLNGIILTPAAATTLGRSLPQMSSLESFEITGVKGRILQHKEIEALFGGFDKTLPLERLTFGGFSMKCCLSALVKSFRFFPNLKELSVGKFSMDEHNLCSLLESLRFIPSLRVLKVQGKRMNYEHSCGAQLNTVRRSFALEFLEELVLSDISLNARAASALGRSLAEMSSLKRLDISGMDTKMLQAEEMKTLFGGLNKTAPLLPNNLCFFPNLYDLRLGKFNMDEQHLCGLMESLRFIPNLWKLCVEGKRLCPADFSSAEVNTVLNFTHETLSYLELKGLSLTPTAAAMLGRSLPTMPSLETIELTGHGSVVPAEQMELLFDGFNKASPVRQLRFRGFNVRGCLAPLTRRFSSFPNLESLELTNLNMDEHDLHGLLESFQFMPKLHSLTLSGNPLGHAVTSIVPHVVNLPRLKYLWLDGCSSEEDLKSVSRELPERVDLLRTCSLITFKTYV